MLHDVASVTRAPEARYASRRMSSLPEMEQPQGRGRALAPAVADDAGPRDAPREKALWAGFVLALWLTGYYGAAFSVDPADARRLATPFDRAIPFWPQAIWGYSLCYTAMLLPLFTVRCHHLFRRVVAAYALVIAVSVLCFVAFPVTSAGFRPDAATIEALGMERFWVWGLRLNLALDPPVNLLPSLHLSSATLVALSAVQARRAHALPALLLGATISASILLVKQHYVVDGVAGVALGLVAWALIVRPHPSPPPGAGADLSYGWRGLAAYASLHAAAIGGLWIAFRLGLRPFP